MALKCRVARIALLTAHPRRCFEPPPSIVLTVDAWNLAMPAEASAKRHCCRS